LFLIRPCSHEELVVPTENNIVYEKVDVVAIQFPALKPRSACKKEAKKHITSLIELAREFVDEKVDVVVIQFLQLTLVSREKICSPSLALTI
jgi:hypothetical protein